ncbi:MAG: metallopeptidase family protein [Elusimicrobia bacterium]|nr:metallopeptidase family protein [Elusimicrobiota bacterium]
MTPEEFEAEVERAVKSLPRAFRDRLANVAVVVKARPTAEQRRRFGPGLLGLYEGVPATERGAADGGLMPDKITLFRESLEEGAGGAGGTAGRVRRTLMHEIAHHFGMDDDELREKGLY